MCSMMPWTHSRQHLARNIVFLLLGRNAHTTVEHKVKVNGIGINFVQSGSGSKTVLLMPGTLGSAWSDFKPQIEKLPQLLPQHTIIAWDPPGYGKSIPPQRHFGYDLFKNDANWAVELMRALGRRKFSVLGWSGGGITGLIMAGQYVECIEKLVVWGCGAYINADEVKGFQDMRNVQTWSPRMREPMEHIFGAEMFAKLWGEWVDIVTGFLEHRDGNFCREWVHNIKAPTFILRGKMDPIIAAEHVPYLRERIMNNRYHEFPEGKHNIHLRYKHEFNRLVSEFLLEEL